MATNDIKAFAAAGGANVLTQAEYLALAALSTGFTSGKANSKEVNKAMRQSSFVAAALAQFISDSANVDVLDDGNVSGLVTKLISALAANSLSRSHPFADIKTDGAAAIAEALSNLQFRETVTGIIGASRNARMSVTAASTTATFSADELIVESSDGKQYRLSNFSKTVNLSTVGAGGMDTGTVPTTGFVALYAIYNPATSTSALLAVDTTSTAAPEIYGGANMPAGFTASALVSIWRVVSGKFIVGEQRGRDISIIDVNAVTTTTNTSSLTAISVASAIPKNAKSIAGWAGTQSNGSSTVQSVRVAGSVQGVALRLIQTNSATAINAPYTLPILTEQTIYYRNETTGTLVSAAIFINEYSF